MRAEMLAVLVAALRAARPVVAANLQGILESSCRLDPVTQEPIRDTIHENDREWAEEHEALLARIDAALAQVPA